jgi:hypothetical protein
MKRLNISDSELKNSFGYKWFSFRNGTPKYLLFLSVDKPAFSISGSNIEGADREARLLHAVADFPKFWIQTETENLIDLNRFDRGGIR